jgi:hypothetical protein
MICTDERRILEFGLVVSARELCAFSARSWVVRRQELSATFSERANGQDVSRRGGDKRWRWRLAGRGDGVADQAVGRHFQAPRRVCSRLRTATESVGRFFQFRTHFVPMEYHV